MGPTDVALDGPRGFVTFGLGEARDPANYAGLDALYELNQRSASWPVTDLGAYEFQNNLDGTILDSNPYRLAIVRDGQVIADANGNDILKRDRFGHLSNFTVKLRHLGRWHLRRPTRGSSVCGAAALAASAQRGDRATAVNASSLNMRRGSDQLSCR